MSSRFATALLLATLVIAVPHGQVPDQAAADKQTAAAPEPAGLGQPVNIRLDLTIIDQASPGDPSRKTMTLVIADRATGSIRSSGNVRGQGRVQINVDARPQILQSGAIRVWLGLEYNPRLSGTDNPTESSALNEQIGGVVLQPGKPMIVSQSADPASDRRITVELTATLLKP